MSAARKVFGSIFAIGLISSPAIAFSQLPPPGGAASTGQVTAHTIQIVAPSTGGNLFVKADADFEVTAGAGNSGNVLFYTRLDLDGNNSINHFSAITSVPPGCTESINGSFVISPQWYDPGKFYLSTATVSEVVMQAPFFATTKLDHSIKGL